MVRGILVSKRKQIEVSKSKIEEQEKYIEAIHRMNEDLFNRTGERKSWLCHTFGSGRCRSHDFPLAFT